MPLALILVTWVVNPFSAMNRDQWFAIGTNLLAVLGTFLAATGTAAEWQDFVTGSLAVIVAFVWSWWLNHGVQADQVNSALRKLLMVGSALAVQRGWLTMDQAAQYSGWAIMAVTFFLSQWHYSAVPGPNLAGTTVVDPPVTQ